MKNNMKNNMKNIVELLSNPELSFELAEKKLNDNLKKGLITEESFEKAMEGLDLLKGSKSNHKYLKIVDGKYIYDYDKMSAQDHRNAQSYHAKALFSDEDRNVIKEHLKLRNENEKLAKEKEEKSKDLKDLKTAIESEMKENDRNFEVKFLTRELGAIKNILEDNGELDDELKKILIKFNKKYKLINKFAD